MTESTTNAIDKLKYAKATPVHLPQPSARTDHKETEQRSVTIRQLVKNVIIRYAPRERRPEVRDISTT